jgi:glutamate-1-semialdehyde aminotransferase
MSAPDHGSRQDALYRTAQAVLPGGVSSSIRLNRALGRPFYVSRGEGAYLSTWTGGST